MANAEVSSVIGEVSIAIDGEEQVAAVQGEIAISLGTTTGIEISSVLLEIATIIPTGEAAVASCIAEIAIAFPASDVETFTGLQSDSLTRRQSLQSQRLRLFSGLKR